MWGRNGLLWIQLLVIGGAKGQMWAGRMTVQRSWPLSAVTPPPPPHQHVGTVLCVYWRSLIIRSQEEYTKFFCISLVKNDVFFEKKHIILSSRVVDLEQPPWGTSKLQEMPPALQWKSPDYSKILNFFSFSWCLLCSSGFTNPAKPGFNPARLKK